MTERHHGKKMAPIAPPTIERRKQLIVTATKQNKESLHRFYWKPKNSELINHFGDFNDKKETSRKFMNCNPISTRNQNLPEIAMLHNFLLEKI
ncbi:hypothetical protein AVEN_54255-1 [Araneus ventricosus]|uniref:Uncharacterized protein n=1 Tax=Araneus ventricosus TaxID=182803 RepID=A0A4Y2ALN1_ARAVE|nr:hypothetical protein AVEN_54255-1 [Araneus ventricosus]